MRSGHTLFELLIYVVIISITLSLIFPFFDTMNKKALLYEDVKSTKSMIRYARIFSYLRKYKVDVFLISKRVMIMVGRKTLKSYELKIVSVRGNTHFAFSKGVPYISGKVEFSVDGLSPVILSVTPVIGKVNVKKREW